MVDRILEYINWVDVLIVILLLRGAYIGFQGGLGREIGRLISIIVAILVSFQNYGQLSNFISARTFISSLYSDIISFTLLLIIVVFIVKLVTAVVRRLMRVEFVSAIESTGGLLLGLIEGGITASLILIILLWLPFASLKEAVAEGSYLGSVALKISPTIHDSLIKFFPGKDRLEKGVNDETG